jgi:hypothetical protein
MRFDDTKSSEAFEIQLEDFSPRERGMCVTSWGSRGIRMCCFSWRKLELQARRYAELYASVV